MKRCREIFSFAAVSLTLLLATSLAIVAQQVPNKTQPSRINIYYHLGSVEVPIGFTGYVGANFTDAWAGVIEAPGGGISVGWRAGLIEYVGEKHKKNIISQKVDTTAGFPINLSRIREKRGETLVAKIGWLEFSSLISSEKDEEIFLAIVRSFKKERCVTCRSLPFKEDSKVKLPILQKFVR